MRDGVASNWTVRDWSDGPLSWRSFFPQTHVLPAQGWKIHVSAAALEAPRLLSAVAGLLQELLVAFKLPRRLADVVFLNSGDAGTQQLGKVLTVYPRNEAQAREAVERLDLAWPASRGPRVQTDLHPRQGSAVSFRYGVYGQAPTLASSTGILSFALTLPDGTLAPDERSCDGTQPLQAPSPPVTPCPGVHPPIQLDECVEVGGRRYVALAQLADTPRARTFLGADLATLHTVVLKLGRPGVAGDARGVDIAALLAREFKLLRRLECEPGLAPRALQYHGDGWPVLVSEDFRGEILSELPASACIACLPLLAHALSRLHAQGIVHGDIKLDNAVCRCDGVGLIDFELAAPVGAASRRGGTPGHLAPEVREGWPASTTRDVYALGGCVAQAILGIPPALLPSGRDCLAALLRNEGNHTAARMVRWLMHPDPGQRPSAAQAAVALQQHAPTWTQTGVAPGRPSDPSARRWCWRTGAEAGRFVASFASTTGASSGWRNEHFMRAFECEAVNLGAAGIMLGLSTLDEALSRNDFEEPVRAGATWLAARPAAAAAAGLFTGNAGVAVALAMAGRRLDHAAARGAARTRFEAACGDRREIDLFSGDAGVLWAGCLLHAITGLDWPLEHARALARGLLGSAQCDGGIPVWRHGTTREVSYLGCAHGSAGVALALACWSRASGEPEGLELARETFAAIARHGRVTRGRALRSRLDDERHHAPGTWCHGVAGYLWALLQALGDDAALRAEIDWAVDCLAGTPSVGTATYCHGLAGQLELWCMLGGLPRLSDLSQARAGKCTTALRLLHQRQRQQRTEPHCFWGSDDPSIVTPDLWIGFLGPACALAMHAAGSSDALLSPAWLSCLAAAATPAALECAS
ncbi:lanthionine synthetase LanC family protein [Azohydromonas australica]|uniref:class III lanthionine synthetase LanKC N-terminal domain-containing protein n=1 Tax=Azohydromonas australica TaxID=364039 RepID=UPI001B7F9FBC